MVSGISHAVGFPRDGVKCEGKGAITRLNKQKTPKNYQESFGTVILQNMLNKLLCGTISLARLDKEISDEENPNFGSAF